jgi:hypothetical protein
MPLVVRIVCECGPFFKPADSYISIFQPVTGATGAHSNAGWPQAIGEKSACKWCSTKGIGENACRRVKFLKKIALTAVKWQGILLCLACGCRRGLAGGKDKDFQLLQKC